MAASKLLGLVFCFLATFEAVIASYEYVFEFGVRNGGIHVYDKEGQINAFHYTTKVYIPCPRYSRISYVKVVVYSITPPKVDFNEQMNVLSITYNWTQIPISTYYVAAKSVSENPFVPGKK